MKPLPVALAEKLAFDSCATNDAGYACVEARVHEPDPVHQSIRRDWYAVGAGRENERLAPLHAQLCKVVEAAEFEYSYDAEAHETGDRIVSKTAIDKVRRALAELRGLVE